MNITVITTIENANLAARKILESEEYILGFDTETTIMNDDGKVSVIQLATKDDCFIFQICRIVKESFPKHLGKLLSTPHILKVGVAAEYDAYRLYKSYNIYLRGVVDIQHLARSFSMPELSMKALVEKLLPSEKKTKCSIHQNNWDIDLSEKMIEYAANDAFLSRKLYLSILSLSPKETESLLEFNIEKECDLLEEWLSTRSTKPRWKEPLINFVSNGYYRWTKIYTLDQRKKYASLCIDILWKKKRIVAQKTEESPLALLKKQFIYPRTKKSIIDSLSNSLSSLAHFSKEEKVASSEAIFNDLLSNGHIVPIGSKYMLTDK